MNKLSFLDSVKGKRLKASDSVKTFKFNKKRVRVLTETEDCPEMCSGVIYWMSRDQRVQGTLVCLP